MGARLQAFRGALNRAQEPDRTDEVLMAVGSLQANLLEVRHPATLNEAEFKVFSQYGEDGIIQYLLRSVEVPTTTFVEIGVESYRESNTRFLALHDNWRGLAIDGDDAHVKFIQGTDIGWKCDIQPVQAFVTAENVNDLVASHGITGDIGLLSIDVDGVDYWIWEALDVVSPAIVVIEYNSIYGPDLAVTVPYSPDFVCGQAHWSHLYFGASLPALAKLGQHRGYRLVAASSNAVNAFFVREDLAGSLPAVEPADAWRASRFLSSRDSQGRLSYVRDHRDRLELIRDLELMDLVTDERRQIGQLFTL